MEKYTEQQALNVIANALGGTLSLSDMGKATPKQGAKAVAAAGTAEALSTTTDVRGVLIQAKPGNTGDIYVGDLGVSSSSYGFLLEPGDSVPLSTQLTKQDLADIFIDADLNGEGVTFLYWE